MNKTNGFFSNESVSVDKIAAASALAMILGLVTTMGASLNSHETLDIKERFSERFYLQQQETGATSRDGLFSTPSQVKQSLPKTDRAKKFNRSLKSEKYWKGLHASIDKSKTPARTKKPRKLPPIVIGKK